MSLTEKRLMFFRAFNSLLGSVGANFCHVVLNIIIVKYKQSLFLWTARWIMDWGNDIIKNAYHKTHYTKWNKLSHDESLLNINTARRYTAVFRKSTVYNTVTFTTAIFFLYWYTGLPYVQYVIKQLLGLPRFENLLLTFCDCINTICTIIQ